MKSSSSLSSLRSSSSSSSSSSSQSPSRLVTKTFVSVYVHVCSGCLYCCRCCCDNIIIEAQIARDLCENRHRQNKIVFTFNENNIIIRPRAYRHNIMKYNIILIQRTTTRNETCGAPPSQTESGAAARYCTASRVFSYGILLRPLCPQRDHPQTPRRSV